jgi:TPR repeat protein
VASLDGSVQSCREVARLHSTGKALFGLRINLHLARYWLDRAAQLNCSASMVQLSQLLETGSGGYQDLVEAAEWCIKAVLARNEEGHELFRQWCLRVEKDDGGVWSQISSHKGFLSDTDIAVLVDYAQARTDIRTLILTAILHEHGALGLSRNPKLSVKLLLRTARGGDAGSQYRMAILAGQKVEKTFAPEETEEYWLRRAADRLHVPAQHRLAEFLQTRAQRSDEDQHSICKLLQDAVKKEFPPSM